MSLLDKNEEYYIRRCDLSIKDHYIKRSEEHRKIVNDCLKLLRVPSGMDFVLRGEHINKTYFVNINNVL